MGMVAKGLRDCCTDDYYMEERSSGLDSLSTTLWDCGLSRVGQDYVTYVNAGRQ